MTRIIHEARAIRGCIALGLALSMSTTKKLEAIIRGLAYLIVWLPLKLTWNSRCALSKTHQLVNRILIIVNGAQVVAEPCALSKDAQKRSI
eukprot:CAMPEP_0168374248 /NCGR_PEP_ID=MMETSP0228-20121227/9204_1 /TAXON_ID=133427 /ORGANISM="Protoceratium reticulatum, Strain CCCM 535 (=CCMP 1889)" /LENGTH=90 /DNA_ID=CAMNT_0008387191 /DNA_START=594 /DNA_END=866 /DNA_ORIENTATION=+